MAAPARPGDRRDRAGRAERRRGGRASAWPATSTRTRSGSTRPTTETLVVTLRASGLVLPRHRRHARDVRRAPDGRCDRRRGRRRTTSSAAARTSSRASTAPTSCCARTSATSPVRRRSTRSAGWPRSSRDGATAFAAGEVDLVQVARLGRDMDRVRPRPRAAAPCRASRSPSATSGSTRRGRHSTTRGCGAPSPSRSTVSGWSRSPRAPPRSAAGEPRAARHLAGRLRAGARGRPRRGARAARRRPATRTGPTWARSSSTAAGSTSSRRWPCGARSSASRSSVETMDFGDFLGCSTRDRRSLFTVNWIADYASPHALYGLLLEPGAREQLRRLGATTTFVEAARGGGRSAGGRGRRRVRGGRGLRARSRRRSSRGRTARRGGSSPTACAGSGTSPSACSTSGGCHGTADPLAGAAGVVATCARLVMADRGRRRVRRLRRARRRLDLRRGDRRSSVDLRGGAPDRLELLLRTPGRRGRVRRRRSSRSATSRARTCWDTSVDYVTPNTLITYRWRATDGRRGDAERRSELIRYDDDRAGLDWQSAQLGEATVHWYGDAEAQARRFGELTAVGVERAEAAAGQRAGRAGRRLRVRHAGGLLRGPRVRARASGPVPRRTPSCARSSCGSAADRRDVPRGRRWSTR